VIDDPFAALIQLKPTRDLPESERQQLGLPRCGRGRPRRIEPASRPVDDYQQRLDQLRGAAFEADPLLVACRAPVERDPRVIDQSMRGIAVEAAAIGFDRMQAERRGADVSQLCSRRISALAQLASLVCERARAGGEPDVDPRDPRVQKIVALFLSEVVETARETMDAKTAGNFTGSFLARIKGWEDCVR